MKEFAVKLWKISESNNLVVVDELLSASHAFTFNGHKVEIRLPGRETYKEHDPDNSRIYLSSWKEIDGNKQPITWDVFDTHVLVYLPKQLALPEQLIQRSPNALDLLTQPQQELLDQTAEFLVKLADDAFDYWARVVRWKSMNSALGRPRIASSTIGPGPYLVDCETKKRIWVTGVRFTIHGLPAVNKEAWDAAQSVLMHGLVVPVHMDLFFDAMEHMKLGDYNRTVVDCAMACETFMRSLVSTNLLAPTAPEIRALLEEVNIRQIMKKAFPSLLTPEEKDIFATCTSELHRLFDYRNKIVHLGFLSEPNEDTCRSFVATTKKIVTLR